MIQQLNRERAREDAKLRANWLYKQVGLHRHEIIPLLHARLKWHTLARCTEYCVAL